MKFSDFRTYCLSKKGVEEAYPFGPNSVWFQVGGKGFCWTFVEDYKVNGELVGPFSFVNMKCEPVQAEEWRDRFVGVVPGWHQSKKHWNTIWINEQLPSIFLEMIDHAYELVYNSLSKKVKLEIDNE